MARSDERFRLTFNAVLDFAATMPAGSKLPSELALSDRYGVSRTVIRSVLARLDAEGLIDWSGRQKILRRVPSAADRLAVQADQIVASDLERQFLNWILRFDIPPGAPINSAELARKFHVTAHGLQEFLASLSQFGLVRRREKGGWEMVGFTLKYALELSEFRTMLELNAIAKLLELPSTHSIWAALRGLKAEHLSLKREIKTRFHDFSLLDEKFHTTIGGVVRNRFVASFQKVIALIFHYHFQWDKRDEKSRNLAAINEHLRIIRALEQRDEAAALEAMRSHLKTSELTLAMSMRDHSFV